MAMPMLTRSLAGVDLEAVVRYVLSKQGSDGGYLSFQYMDMFESSAEDTYYAISVLKLLKVEPPRIKDTVEFLRRLQHRDGSYSSVEVAYYSITALYLLGASPRDTNGASEYLKNALASSTCWENFLPSFETEQLINESGVLKSKDATYALTSADLTPVPVRASMVVLALNRLGSMSGEVEEKAYPILKNALNGGSLGAPDSLEVAYWTLEALSTLNYTIDTDDLVRWIRACENEDGGFSSTPSSRTAFVDNLYFGLRSLEILGTKPRYPARHVEYVVSLQNANGGFRRSRELGASSLSYTYYAIQSMSLLDALHTGK
jgi:hypothetical protein